MSILVVSNRPPDPWGTGDAKIAHDVMRTLQDRGEHVDLIVTPGRVQWAGFPRRMAKLAVGAPMQTALTLDRATARRVATAMRDVPYDCVIAVHARALNHVPTREWHRTLAILIDSYGTTYRTFSRVVGPARALFYRYEAQRMLAFEREAVSMCRAVGLVSPREVTSLRRMARDPDVIIHLPYSVDTESFEARDDSFRHRLVFTGRLSYLPNHNAAMTLVRSIWPAVQREMPTTTLTIAGAGPRPLLKDECAANGVDLISDPPDLRPILAAADVMVVPLNAGGGVQTKLLEAMASGLPIVCSPLANAGLGAEPERHLLLARSPHQFVTQIERLMASVALRDELARSAEEWLRQRHSPECFSRALLQALQLNGPKSKA